MGDAGPGQSGSQTHGAPESGSKKRRIGCLGWLGIIVASFVGLFLLGLIGTLIPKPPRQRAVEKPPVTLDSVKVAECDRMLAALISAEVVQSMDVDGARMRVFVGRNFYALTYVQKEGLAKVMSDCLAEGAGMPGGGATFDLCDAYSGELLYRWNGIKLISR